ncbi:HAMP domain-containing histidine kinase [Zooshikella marina]|uniref:sensor histidine kinase n=1 Tax=Zooshikella ganghwensis TaxID=202772 RepID=UPI001BB06895|nr:HAMP domain-containing sensor histidine kinase [Zooshikella ganghwensis]MBU2708201.1 HAMP domain-containing histidine kinase [Zooshikella ganghwensis]
MVNEEEFEALVYGISHDMGACLRNIASFSNMLSARLETKLNDKERYWFQILQNNAEKAQQMINALLTYSRLHQPQSSVHINVTELLQQVFQETRQKYQSDIYQNIKLLSPTQIPTFIGIEKHWQLYFSNIIDNAFLYQPKSKPEHTPTIWVHCTELIDGMLNLTIEDNGIGVSDQQLTNLACPFMRGHSDKDYPGLGMGLALCTRIVHLHKGELQFSHSPNGGLTVSCTIQMVGNNASQLEHTAQEAVL